MDDFSDLPPSFLQEFLYDKEIVSRSILESAEEAAKTLHVKDIPEEQCIPSPELIAWMKDDDDDQIDEDADHPAKKGKLRDVCNRFGIVVTDGDTLATFSKGFVPDTTKSNTQLLH